MNETLKKRVESLASNMNLLGTEEGKKQFDTLFQELNGSLSTEDKREAGAFLRELRRAKRSLPKRRDVNVKEMLTGIQEFISLSYIAQKYFGKDRTWLYQRINGTLVNGVPAAFTNQELDILANALEEIGAIISETSSSFKQIL